MSVAQTFVKLWNGGLNPITADPKQLGERRMFSTISFVIVPSCTLLIASNILYLQGNLTRVFFIFLVIVVCVTGLYLQAYKGWQRFSAISLIATLWIVPTMLIFGEGFSSSNWAWLLPVILLANFLLSRGASIVFTALSVVVMISTMVLTFNGHIGYTIETQEHAITVAISGSLIFVLACALGYAYRTSQIKSQDQLKANMEALAHEVEFRRTAEAKALAGERAKATFLTTVSHELRTPLNGVIGASQLLEERALEPGMDELVDIIKDSAEILLDVINNVLDLSRLEEGRLDLHMAPMSLRAVIESGFAPLLVACREKHLHMELHVADDVPDYVVSDATRIKQLILNLCGNAIKFTRRGGIDIRVARHDEVIEIAVEDTGIGIQEDKLEEIFNPFVQAETAPDRRFGGSGLGLSIVQRLVNLFGGSIDVESEVGQGTRFILSLPMEACTAPGVAPTEIKVKQSPREFTRPANAPVRDADACAETTDLTSFTVLVTDDNVVNRKVANKLLQKLGCRVVEAADGLEAIASVQKGNVDAVLMDVQMPNMDGITATNRIRAMERPFCDTPIIGLSANAMPGDETQMLDAGMDCYLSKPVRLDNLRKALAVTAHAPV